MKKRRGFTLMELMLVIVIIGILSSVIVLTVAPALRTRGYQAACQSLLDQVMTADKMYYSVIGNYPGSIGNMVSANFIDPNVPDAAGDPGDFYVAMIGSGATGGFNVIREAGGWVAGYRNGTTTMGGW